MNKRKLLQELKQTQKMLEQVDQKLNHTYRRFSVESLLRYYYRGNQEKLNHDNPGALVKIIQLVSDRSVHWLLFIISVIYPLSLMSGNIFRTFTHAIPLSEMNRYIIFNVSFNISIYILLLLLYMFSIKILIHRYKKGHPSDCNLIKDLKRFSRSVNNQILLYVINMFTLYATLIGTIFTISSSVGNIKVVMMIVFFFSMIIIPTLSISLFVATINRINDNRI